MVAPVCTGSFDRPRPREHGRSRPDTSDRFADQSRHQSKRHLHREDLGSETDRPELNAYLAKLQQGDTLVVWRLDRLGRSMHYLVELIEELRNRGVGFRSVSD